jgi:spore germination protein YaaH
MRIPLYGRAWQTPSLAKAYKNREVVSELRERGIRPSYDLNMGGAYSFKETVTVHVHYETIQSLEAKKTLYGSHPTQGIALWRISQEPDGFWEMLSK